MDLILVEGNKEDIKDFLIGKYQVTQKEYEEIMGCNPSHFKGEPNNPVEMVSWYDAVMYCNVLSEIEGLNPYYDIIDIEIKNKNITSAKVTLFGGTGYRLPTNEEWMYAARGGNQSNGYTYAGSNNIDEVAWFNKNSGGTTHPVGLKIPNELGIYDMSGNVWEWTGTKNIEDSNRYFIGGSWFNFNYSCEVDVKITNNANIRYAIIGFRVCRISS